MSDLYEEFELRAQRAAEERRRIDFDDLQNERAGLETGRMARFLDADAREARGDRSKGSDKTGAHLSRLQQLLASNPAYAALYNDTFDKLRAAEAAAERALSLAIEARAKARQALDDTLERAATLPDGTRVFRDDNGDVRTEHGDKIAPEIAAGIQWRGSEPSYEDFQDAQRQAASAAKYVSDIQDYQVDVLGRARDRLTDEDNPPTQDELREIQRDIYERKPEAISAHSLDPMKPTDSSGPALSTLDIPKL